MHLLGHWVKELVLRIKKGFTRPWGREGGILKELWDFVVSCNSYIKSKSAVKLHKLEIKNKKLNISGELDVIILLLRFKLALYFKYSKISVPIRVTFWCIVGLLDGDTDYSAFWSRINMSACWLSHNTWNYSFHKMFEFKS